MKDNGIKLDKGSHGGARRHEWHNQIQGTTGGSIPSKGNEPAEGAQRQNREHAVRRPRPRPPGRRRRGYAGARVPPRSVTHNSDYGGGGGLLAPPRSNKHRLCRRECRCRLPMLMRSRRSSNQSEPTQGGREDARVTVPSETLSVRCGWSVVSRRVGVWYVRLPPLRTPVG